MYQNHITTQINVKSLKVDGVSLASLRERAYRVKDQEKSEEIEPIKEYETIRNVLDAHGPTKIKGLFRIWVDGSTIGVFNNHIIARQIVGDLNPNKVIVIEFQPLHRGRSRKYSRTEFLDFTKNL